MAKRNSNSGGVSKSDSIRELLGKNPKTPVKEVVATLGQQGITVKPNHVYLIKSKMTNRKRRQKRQRAVETSGKAGVLNPIDLILKVKKLATEAGGMANFKMLVDVLAE